MNEAKEEVRMQQARRALAPPSTAADRREQHAIRGVTVKRKSTQRVPIAADRFEGEQSVFCCGDTLPHMCCCKRLRGDERHAPGGDSLRKTESVTVPVRTMLESAAKQQKLEWKQVRTSMGGSGQVNDSDENLARKLRVSDPISDDLSVVSKILEVPTRSATSSAEDDEAACLSALEMFEKETKMADSMAKPDERQSIKSMLDNWNNPVFKAGARVMTLKGQGPEYSISRASLSTLSVIGQLDTKYILCRSPDGMLLAVDQHAADERVRLECLTRELLDQYKQGEMPSVEADPPKVVELDAAERDLVVLHKDTLSQWGWDCILLTDVDALCDPMGLAGHHVGSLRRVPVVRCVALGPPEFKEHLHQLKDTNGATRNPPPGILRVLNSVACRGAVMFGDSLDMQQCMKTMEDLSQCDHPFQCAHGRPSMAPLMAMPEVRSLCYIFYIF